jgi:4-amino-4-deoxy-L-arabinose transferase-like glycosyltransferase
MSISHTVIRNRSQYVSYLIRAFDSPHAIYFLIGLGVLVRLIPLSLVGGKFLAHENPSYDVMAGQLMRNEHFSAYWPPGLPYYLSFFHALFGHGMLVARASILVVYVGFSVASYGLIKNLASRRAGNLAVLVFAFYPSYIRYAFDPSTEYLTATCLLVIVYCTILTLRKPSFWLAVFLGVSLGAVALVRANSLALAIVVPAYLVFRTRRWSIAMVSLLISSILVSAWLWKVSDMAGHFIFINDSNEENIVFSNHPATPLYLTCRDCPIYGRLPARFLELEHEIDYKPPLEQQRQLRQTTIRFILTHPDLFALRTFNRFRAYFRFPIHYADPLVRHSNTGRSMRQWLGSAITVLEVAFFWPLMALAIISCFNFPSLRLELDALFTTLGVVAVYALPCWLTWSEPRYAFPVIPLFAVFSFVLLDSLLTRPWRQVLAPVLNSTSRKRAMLLTLSIFFCIQIEWIVLIVSASAWHDKWAHLVSFW